MKLTIDQALQQGVSAHKEGKLQDAERLYRAILKSQPNHPDANHNLGLLAVAVGKPLEASPLFKLALEANPQIEQFWLSYINVLIGLERFDEAKRALVEGGQSGVSSEKLDVLNQQLLGSVPNDTNKIAEGQTLTEERKAQGSSSSAPPPQDQLIRLIEHYQVGRLEEAEELATLLTQQFPKHPFGWKVLGAVLQQMGRVNESLLPMQESADLSPLDAEARSNLGVTLKELGRLDDAEASYRTAIALKPDYAEAYYNLGNTLQELGRLDDAEASYRTAIALKPDYAEAYYNFGNTLQELGRLDDAEASYREAIALRPDFAEAHNNLGNTLKELGRLDDAEASYREAIALKPDYAEAHSNLGVTLEELGRLDDAEASHREAIAVKPDFAEAHNNLGVTLKELGRLDDAGASYRGAIALNPDYAEAHNNLGIMLKELGRLDDAEASYRAAIALKPGFTEAHNNLGVTLQALGRLDESIPAYFRAIDLKADSEDAYFNLGSALERTRFSKGDQSLYPILINLLIGGNFVRPIKVAGAICSLLRLDNRIEEVLLNTTASSNIEEIDGVVKTLAQVPLLHQLMRICPLPDLQLEALFVSMRRVILAGRGLLEPSPDLIHFLSTLSLHCYINEHIYFESKEETELVSVLEEAIAMSIAQSSQPTVTDILILAAYRPIHQHDWSEKLQVLDQLPEVKARLIREPLAERVMMQDMAGLAGIEDSVSRMVREQYEESPYPRWVRLQVPQKGKSVAKIFDEAKLHLKSESIKSVFIPTILIAGCGTGQHSIETASRFANCKVTAIDLSRTSLAYAQRKTSELGITNIQYLHADILSLGELGQEFDVIECAGVLHHMDDPMAGWHVLVSLLKTGGMMRIGLYSELARRHIAMIRENIALEGIRTSAAEMRQVRQTLAQSDDEHQQKLVRSNDFFSLSTFRDLIFHVQEHRFTIPQIQRSLDQLGLAFCGFEQPDIVAKFREVFGKASDACDLSSWHQFEESHLNAFAGMYQFWCQKL
ncbi:MAG: hypothetical protein CMD99_09110 [Gammaproteobacteria bacterium]|nr:hypothetical protein [Gammaproteobacteria bacterium]